MSSIVSYVFSANFLFMWIRVVTPILFPALGAVVGEKSGVVNLGLDGIMLISAFFGVIGSWICKGLWGGILFGVGSALIVSAIFAFFHLVLKANNVLCGTAVNTIGGGLTVFILQLITGEKGSSSSLKSFQFPTVNIPVIRDIPVLGDILSGHNLLTYMALISVFLVYFFLYKTPLGLRIRAVGENPNAAESVGISVIRMRFIATLICGFLASFGGMYLSMGYLPLFTRDMTAGRGFISLASCAMGHQTPFGTLFGALVFAFFDGLSNILQLLRIPAEFVQMLPYLATILGLTIYSIQAIAQENRKNKKFVEKAELSASK